MTDETRRTVRMYLGAVAAGCVTFTGIMSAALAGGGDIQPNVWLLAVMISGGVIAQNVSAALSQPPGQGKG
jgi:hypothetical protein